MRKLLIGLLALALPFAAEAQLYPLFGPVNGVLKGNSATPQTSAAAATDIVALWSGCSGVLFLRQDGTCAAATTAAAGSNTQIQYNNSGAFGASTDFTWTDASKTLSLNNGGAAASSTVSVANNASGNGKNVNVIAGGSTGSNGTGGSLTLNAGFGNGAGQGGNVSINAGDSGVTGTNNGGAVNITGGRGQTPGPAFGGAVNITGGTVLADGNGGGVNITGSPGVGTNRSGGGVTVNLGAATGTGTPGIFSVLAGKGAVIGAPTGGAQGVGTLNATGLFVNGVAVSGGGTPGGANTNLQFNNAGVFGGDSGFTYAGAGGNIVHTVSSNVVEVFQQTNSSNGAAAAVQIQQTNDASHNVYIGIAGSGNTGVQWSGGPTGEQAFIGSSGSIPLTFGQNNTIRFSLSSAIAGETGRIITNGTGVSSQAYWAWYDQAGTRFGYVGKAGTSDGTITLDSDANLKMTANNGALNLQIDGTNGLTYQGVPVIAQGTFTMTYNGFSAGCALTSTWTRAGQNITLVIPGSAVCASNATTFTATGIPAAIQPAQAQQLGMYTALCEDNSVIGGFTCGASISGGTITFSKNNSASGWTASNQKGVTTNLTVTYLLN